MAGRSNSGDFGLQGSAQQVALSGKLRSAAIGAKIQFPDATPPGSISRTPSPVAVLQNQSTPQSSTWSHAISDSTGVLYTPREEDFRPRYDEDGGNRAVQSWDEYWRWVKTFCEGNLLARGWIRECEAILEKIGAGGGAGAETGKLEAQFNELISLLNILGRLVAAEWSKDNGVRKIDTAEVRRWRSTLRKAADRVPPDGIESLIDTLKGIEELVISRLNEGKRFRI